MKSRKPVAIAPSTPSTRACNTLGKSRPKAATAAPQRVSTSTHSTIDPS